MGIASCVDTMMGFQLVATIHMWAHRLERIIRSGALNMTKELQAERAMLALIANRNCHGIWCDNCAMGYGVHGCIIGDLKKLIENADNVNSDA